MLTTDHQARFTSRPRLIFAAATLALLFLTCLACGNSDSPTGIAQTEFDPTITFNVDNLVDLGLKIGKEYDTSTLEGANAAFLLFWRVEGTAVEYEVRFYPDSQTAESLGHAPATEGSGPNAILDIDDAQYKEGIRDRRTIFDFRGEPKPKYGGYTIFQNFVALCEGRDEDEAQGRCTALVNALAVASQ